VAVEQGVFALQLVAKIVHYLLVQYATASGKRA